MEKSDIEKMEQYGYVADSAEVRNKLIILLDNNEKSLEKIQTELKEIQKNAFKKGFYTRSQLFNSNKSIEELIELAEKQKKIYSYNKLLKNLPKKKSQKKHKI